MPDPLSIDLRKRILIANEKGKAVKEIVENFSVGKNTVYCLLKLLNEPGSYEPKTNKNGRKI